MIRFYGWGDVERASMKKIILFLMAITLNGCMGMPETITPVTDFDLDKYLGKWYEVARLDHSFERGLEQVTAEYSLRDDGGVSVVNRGFLKEKNEWKEAEGKAYFVNEPNEGYLKVSFFGPFYGSYVIFGLDQDAYQYAFISGPDLSYLWLLSRKPVLEPEIIAHFTQEVERFGYDSEALIFVKHRQTN